MMKSVVLVVVVIGLVLAGCNLGVPENPVTTDWCYTFDFTADDYNFSLPYGLWEAESGFLTDQQGRLSMGYLNPVSVQSTYIILTLNTLPGFNPTVVNFTSNGNIFGFNTGVPVSGNINVSAGSTELFLQPDPNDFSASINFTIQSSTRFAVSSLEVRGNGVNPFPVNNCDTTPEPPTPTDFVATDLPTNTPTAQPTATALLSPTPTSTSTATDTPAATATPTGFWCDNAIINFDDGEDVPWFNAYPGLVAVSTAEGYTGDASEWTGTTIAGDDYYQDYVQLALDVSNLTGIKRIRFRWRMEGTEFPVNAYVYSGTESNYFLNVIHSVPWRANASTWVQETVSELDFNGTTYRYVYIYMYTYSQHAPRSFYLDDIEICHQGFVNTPTPTSTYTASPTFNFSATPTLTLTPAGTSFTTQAVRSSTPSPTIVGTRATATRVPIFTPPPLATLPPPLTPLNTVTAHPSYTPDLSSTYQFYGTMTATYGGTGTPAATGTAYTIPWPTSFPGDGSGGGDGGSGVGGVAGYGNGVLGFVSNAMHQGIAWLGEFRLWATNLLTSYQNAPPQPLPGLPHCATNRFASELCAIYYILNNTVFAGPLGSIIIAVAVADIDLVTVFSFILLARAILSRLAEILRQ